MVARLRDRVRAGEFEDESAAIEDALAEAEAVHIATTLAPVLNDQETDDRLRTQITAALAAYDADPSRGLTIDQVRENLARFRARREQAGC